MKPAFPILLGRHWDGIQQLKGWWMSEKLDGWRAYRTADGKLLTREGNEVNAPDWWLAGLPAGVELDGELWLGRGTISALKSILGKNEASDEDWMKVQFAVFDVPSHPGTFEERQAHLTSLDLGLFAFRIEQTVCPSNDVAKLKMNMVVLDGGEGIMMRKPGSLYERERSYTLLKVKPKPIIKAPFAGGVEAGFGW